jgi:hypothetical protein
MTDTTQSTTETATTVTETALNAEPVAQATQTDQTAQQQEIKEAPVYEAIKWDEMVLPEDFDRTDPSFTGFQQLADAAKINKEQAAKFVEMGTKLRADTIAQETARVEAIKAEWLTSSKNDKEYGGEKFDENMSVVKLAYDEMATPELKQLMDKTGMGNHPDMIRAFYRMGMMMKQDGHVNANYGSKSDEMSLVDRFYSK